jgi:class 3 adenylate cyclase/TolB-like protein
MVHDRPARVERRLSAILAADVAGYSRLMHQDEEATHAKLKALLAGGIEPAIAEHGGRIVKNTGDGFLAEFPSAVEAVRAAMQFQTRIKELTIGELEDRRIAFRVGVNIGDVIVEAHDIFGDGVNIAARLESIAEPGGICISSSAYDQVRGKVGVEFADLGEQHLKNIARPVRAYAVIRDGLGAQIIQNGGAAPASLSAPRLSIAVLPFANLGGDAAQGYFVDAITDIPGLFVIGRNTAFAYKDTRVDARRIGRELGIGYVMEGSVLTGADRIRVNAQLIDAGSGAHLWAERFDKPRADVFDMQDEITVRLARSIGIELVAAEGRRAERERPHNMDAVDLTMRGRAILNLPPSVENARTARALFEAALRLDDRNAEVSLS